MTKYVINTAGEAYSWGFGSYGLLGNGANASSNTPVKVIRPVDVSPFKEITTGGYYHIAAILENQTAVTWGWGVYGQLGRGSTADSNVPVKVPGVANVVSIDTGYYHTIAATASGQVYAWGNNSNRQVSQESSPVYVLSPRIVGGALTGKRS